MRPALQRRGERGLTAVRRRDFRRGIGHPPGRRAARTLGETPLPRFEQDTIRRQIRQLGDLVAAIVARARADADYTSGLEAIREASASRLGPDRTLLDRLDAEAAALLLRDPDVVRAYSDVCEAESELLGGLGRSEEAEARRTRARALARAANPGVSGAALPKER